MPEAYVTLATDDRYALGALVLAHSLRNVNTTKQLCILITPGVSEGIRSQLTGIFNEVVNVDVLDSNESEHLALLKRPELGITFTKLHCWTLTQYEKCVFLDADMLAVQNADELFEEPELSATCDIGWPDCFNSGMFVFSPSKETYDRLLQHAEQVGSFDGGDQGLLNTFFNKWNRLSFIYNMVASATYTYLPAYKQFGKNVKFVHFLGATKPWHQTYHTESGTVVSQQNQEHISNHLNNWWRIFASSVKPKFPESDLSPKLNPMPSNTIYKVITKEDEGSYSVNEKAEASSCFSPNYVDVGSKFVVTRTIESNNVIPNESYMTHDTQVDSDQSNSNVNLSKTDENEYCNTDEPHNENLFQPSSYESLCSDYSGASNNTSDFPSDINPSSTLTQCNYSSDPDNKQKSEPPLYTDNKSEETCSNIKSANNNLASTNVERKEESHYPTSPAFPFPNLICPRLPSPFSGQSESTPLSKESSKELCEHIDRLHVCPAESLEESRRRWEQGAPDFRGRDSFDNILAHIDSVIQGN